MDILILVLIVLILIGAIPAWPHAQNWGYGPFGLILTILLIILLFRLI